MSPRPSHLPTNVVRLSTHPAPAHLEPEEREFWDSITHDYAITGDAALKILITACDALAMARKCREQIAVDGVCVKDRWGQPKPHPLLREAAVARSSFLASMRALRLDIGPER